MREQRSIMGMPITVEIAETSAGSDATAAAIRRVFGYFDYIDKKFSTYKADSEISKINRHEIRQEEYSQDMKEVLDLCELTRDDTGGYFDIRRPDGGIDPSGLVKGWAVRNAADILHGEGLRNFFIEAGGDIQASGRNAEGRAWRVGIRNPFNSKEIVKAVNLSSEGIATSGLYERGHHIYNPHDPSQKLDAISSVTIIAENVYEADRFATAAYAMGRKGIAFLEQLPNIEAYVIDAQGMAIQTSGFDKYAAKDNLRLI